MAYVSGIAGLGNSADSLRQLQSLTTSAILNFNRQITVSALDKAYATYEKAAIDLHRRLDPSETRGDIELDKARKARDIKRSSLIGASTSSASTSTNLDTEFGTWITSLSPDTRQSVLKASDYDDLDRASAAAKASKPAEKGVFDAIGDVFSGVADAAKSLLPTALAVTKAQQERKQQEQLARLQAAGLLPQQQAQTGMSTTTKVALGAGGALLLGFIIYKVATR